MPWTNGGTVTVPVEYEIERRYLVKVGKGLFDQLDDGYDFRQG